MVNNSKNTPLQILKNAKNILLVDWPNQGVPRTLLNAGFTLYSYSPGGYAIASLVTYKPEDIHGKGIFSPKHEGEKGHLVFTDMNTPPESVDIVNVYRPEEEMAEIAAKHVLPLGAKVFWLHPPVASAWARDFAALHDIVLVQGVDIADVAIKI